VEHAWDGQLMKFTTSQTKDKESAKTSYLKGINTRNTQYIQGSILNKVVLIYTSNWVVKVHWSWISRWRFTGWIYRVAL
jgi:Tfp pilus assembly major pilin PilA